VAVVCGGDLDIMTLRHSKATWLEEWFYYCEQAYGRSRVRSEDLAKDYQIDLKPARKIFLYKLQLVLHARSRYPKYSTHLEDTRLRDSK
jgi:hypothetical protein